MWTWYDYVDDRGRNVINRWLDRDLPRGTRESVGAAIDASMDLVDAVDDITTSARFTALTGEHAGIIEMRFKESGVQCRPLLCAGPNQDDYTLLVGARKRGRTWTPQDARNTALAHRQRIHEEGRVIEHGKEPKLDNPSP